MSACRAKGTWSEADELRQRLEEARRELASVRAERDEALATLAEAERVRLATGGELSAEVAAALPRCAGVEIDRLSGPTPAFDAVEVYVRPFDGRRRFVQVVGRLRVRADAVPSAWSESAMPPRMLGQAELGPGELREAYRSSVMGTHYAVRVPVEAGAWPTEGSVAVSVELLDALSGRVHRAESLIGVGVRR